MRAENDEGPGAWSATATASVAANALPAFTLGLAPAFDARLRENSVRVVAVTASDPDAADAVTGYTLGGADERPVRDRPGGRCALAGVPRRARLRGARAALRRAPRNPNVYEVTVTATGGDGARARSVTAAGRVMVTDADEAPVFSGDAAFERGGERHGRGNGARRPTRTRATAVTGYRVAGGADAALVRHIRCRRTELQGPARLREPAGRGGR